MKPSRLFVLLGALLWVQAARADAGPAPLAAYDPTQHWEVDYESGVLWRFSGDATPLTYTFMPQMVTFKSPLVGTVRPFLGGDLGDPQSIQPPRRAHLRWPGAPLHRGHRVGHP